MLADNFKGEYYVGQNTLNKYVQAISFYMNDKMGQRK